jgi:hypothetical protein
MQETLFRVLENLGDRVGGPMTFRFILQPLVAVTLGTRDGLRIAKTGRALLSWRHRCNPATDQHLVRTVWQSVRLLVFVAVVLDIIYQLLVRQWVYPGETLIVLVAITLVPYLLTCSIVSALQCWRNSITQQRPRSHIRRR